MKSNLFATFLMVVLIAAQSQAKIFATATNGNPFSIQDGAAHLIPLQSNGNTTLTFKTTTANQKVIIQFNAECSVSGVDDDTWLDIDILVDGVAAPPSDGDNAFCTSLAGHAGSRWVSAVTNGVAVVRSPGTHTLQVRGAFGFGHWSSGDFWWVDDYSIIVFN
jgi:hypothetical protein